MTFYDLSWKKSLNCRIANVLNGRGDDILLVADKMSFLEDDDDVKIVMRFIFNTVTCEADYNGL